MFHFNYYLRTLARVSGTPKVPSGLNGVSGGLRPGPVGLRGVTGGFRDISEVPESITWPQGSFVRSQGVLMNAGF